MMIDASQAILEARGLTADYGEGAVLQDVSFTVREGEFLGIAGPNGAGKSTLLRILAGLMAPATGDVLLDGRALDSYSPRRLARRVAVIFQQPPSPYDFTVFDMVAMGRMPYLARWKPLSAIDRQVIASAMDMTEITELRNRPFLELSGGEKQRVIIAKALAQEPSLLLLDEPSTHLDLHHQVAVFNILRRLNRSCRATILCITHDLTLGAQYIDRLLLLRRGCLLAEGSPDAIIQKEMMEDLFHTPIAVGMLSETDTPYVVPLRSFDK